MAALSSHAVPASGQGGGNGGCERRVSCPAAQRNSSTTHQPVQAAAGCEKLSTDGSHPHNLNVQAQKPCWGQ